MKTSAIPRIVLATALLTLASAESAFATPYTYSDTLTANSPSFARPPRTFGDYRYSAFEFTTSQTGNYQITTQVSNYDSYLFLYAGSFDPNDPLANLIESNDDGTSPMTSSLVAALAKGINYYAINTTYSVFSAYPNIARFTTTIDGPGVITAITQVNAVPEPATFALFLAGLGLMGYAVKRREPTAAKTDSPS